MPQKQTPLTRKFPHLNIDTLPADVIRSKAKLLLQAKQEFLNSNQWKRIKDIRQQKEEKRVRFREVHGDLFETKAEAIAHCVSEDLGMGKGIAVEFVKRFGRKDDLKEQNPRIGEVVFLERDKEEVMRVVFYMITKSKYWQIPAYQAVWDSLVEMRQQCEKMNVKSLGMPVIACGLDCLEWSIVKEMIQVAFWDLDFEVTIYVHHPEKVQ
mmetsp:Transcript_38/g.145  ORF Transcript_38/g.145 Transcript_38/m.145 type:complete len:210 (-) Transcript_38:197-826(-)|eukprot:CAMPEP_0117444668 /NCGR_PEP_ID=MMETSP0759-20121206/5364_1 /TAXON_ID=63605 /ORGANISM="Percolomonas cosmopolitus, Strain WS" /LENGTH=209 /DNA_ID=CAMNT_0005236751 /DNA_START=438 /DNA_END=1067 /DNA_ORIENTATION=-